MKKITLLLFIMLTFSFSSIAQVNINESFDAGIPAAWTTTYATSATEACNGSSARDNIYTSAGGNMATDNQVGASNGTDLDVSFDYKIVDWSAATAATPAGWGTSLLQYSTDAGTTWTTALTIDDTNHVVSNVCATMSVTIPAASLPSGSDVQLQIANTYTAGDYYFYIDDFSAVQVIASPPACPANVMSTPDSACGNFDVPLSWDASIGASGYRISVGTTMGGTDVENLTDLGNALTYTIANPTAGQTYYYTVLAYNGIGDSSGCTENTVTTFATGCYCDSMPSSNDGTGIGNLQVGATDFASGGDITYEDFTGAPVNLGQGISANVQITFNTGYTYDTNIWIDFNDDFTFEASELLYSGVSLSSNPTTLDASFTMPAAAALGQHRMRIGTADSGQATPNACYNGSYGVTMDVDVNIVVPTCTAPTGTATLVTDCPNMQFFVDVDVTGLGDGTSVINDGTTTYPATALGVVQVGPYADASSVTIVLENGGDPTCDITLGTISNTCPPSNDDCANATDIAPSTTGSEVWITGTTTANTASGEVAGADVSCGNFGSGRDTWFTTTVPAAGDITITTQASAGSALTDTTVSVFSGTCGAMAGTEITCDDDGGAGAFSEIVLTGQTAGATLYIRVQEYGAAASRRGPQDGPFEIAAHATDPTLSTQDINANGLAFTYYPNPVNDNLALKSQKDIESISVYNMLGQEVLRTAPNAVNTEVNMSALQSGAYFVKVTIGSVTETVRIIKN